MVLQFSIQFGVQAEDGRNGTVKLEMTREGFYELMSVVDPTLAPSPSP